MLAGECLSSWSYLTSQGVKPQKHVFHLRPHEVCRAHLQAAWTCTRVCCGLRFGAVSGRQWPRLRKHFSGSILAWFSMPPRSLDTACWSMRSGAREERTPDSRQSQLFSCSPAYGMRPWDDSPSCDLSRCAPLSSETQSQVKEKINHGFIPTQPLSLRGNQPFPCFLQPLLQTNTHKTDGWDFKARTQGDYLSFLLVPFKIKQHNEYINGTIPSLSLTKSLSWWLDKTPAHTLHHFGGKLQRFLREDLSPHSESIRTWRGGLSGKAD